MQFFRNGPSVPERLLQAHEEGDVVFFCGAGISYPAGLPDFSGLVQRLYEEQSATPNPVQRAAMTSGQLDTAVGLLEADVIGGREVVRRSVASILTPDLGPRNSTRTHDALLTLARSRDNKTRLITTNFDRVFEHVLNKRRDLVPTYQAPLLPVPKLRWDGLVYLHGLLPEVPTTAQLDRLVISSGDFGLAYLTERWAARFVSELFRNYIVCFVGYSINDPVLRYMTDALAADRLLGESPPEMFAFGSYPPGKFDERNNIWKAKNVTPILYKETKGHSYLHRTLRAWARTYRDGVRGKESIVVECAIARPLASTKEDDFVGRMLWALCDPSGLPARRLAELNPAPSLEWLEPMSIDQYGHPDLSRFGIDLPKAIDKKLTFSLSRRPTPHTLAPWMTLAGQSLASNSWDKVMEYLGLWLLRYLDDPKLLHWALKRGVHAHDQFVALVAGAMEKYSKLERAGDASELARIRSESPMAIPRPAMRKIWWLIMAGRVKGRVPQYQSLYLWTRSFLATGLNASTRSMLRACLTPCLELREPYSFDEDDNPNPTEDRVRSIVEWEVSLSTEHAHSALKELVRRDEWRAALPPLFDEFSRLLQDALELMAELGEASSERDNTYVSQPSISEHSQNRDFHDWTVLIELTRDAWLETSSKFPEHAKIAAEAWAVGPYPVFRRLAFFAATQLNTILPGEALSWLLAEQATWLWSIETRREAMRLLVHLAPRLDERQRESLELSILSGPLRALYRDDLDSNDWKRTSDREVWVRLAKMLSSGAELGPVAQLKYELLSTDYPQWRLASDERDEFPFWMESGWAGDRDPWRNFVPIPRTRRGVLDYLVANPELDGSFQDDWRARCTDSFQATSYALRHLACKGIWPEERWRQALQAWADQKLRNRSWTFVSQTLVSAAPSFINSVAHGVSWYLREIGDEFSSHEEEFFELARGVLNSSYPELEDSDDPVSRAINHPIGHVTEALIRWWYRQNLEDGKLLPEILQPLFSNICDNSATHFLNGKVILAVNSVALYRVDPKWSTQHLLPLFSWRKSRRTARCVWEGLLWSPRVYAPFIAAIKQPLLETASNYLSLSKHESQFSSLLVFIALDAQRIFTEVELAEAFRALPADGLNEAGQALMNSLEGTASQKEEHWKNRVLPFWQKIWPKSAERLAEINAEWVARLCIASGDEFPAAMDTVGKCLKVAEHPDYIFYKLNDSGLCSRFPSQALRLMDAILAPDPRWVPSELRGCLEQVEKSEPQLVMSTSYRRLDNIARRYA